MDTKISTTPRPANANKAPYRQPKLRAYGSVQSMTLARVDGKLMDGGGGGGKTSLA